MRQAAHAQLRERAAQKKKKKNPGAVSLLGQSRMPQSVVQ
jgi:hypothetical protein